jgi:2-phosphoglycerate kinase
VIETVPPPPEGIYVRTGRQTIPFSRGILSKSLTRAGVGVEEAYSIAEEIETEMSGSEKDEIQVDDLMNHIYKKLRERGLYKAATNYMVWRNVRKLKVPIIIMIGGGTGVGKSTISTEIAFRLGINYTISTDTIREVMRRMVTSELMPTLAASSFEADELITIPSPMIDKTIYAFERQVSHVSVGINGVLNRAIKESIPMIIDGVHCIPGYYQRNPKGAIMFQFILYVSDVEQHRAHFYARGIGSQRAADRYVARLDNIRRIQDFILERAKAYGIPTIDNTNLEDTTEQILEIITDRLKEELES